MKPEKQGAALAHIAGFPAPAVGLRFSHFPSQVSGDMLLSGWKICFWKLKKEFKH